MDELSICFYPPGDAMNTTRFKTLTPQLLLVKLLLLFFASPLFATVTGIGFGVSVVVTFWYLFLRPGRVDEAV